MSQDVQRLPEKCAPQFLFSVIVPIYNTEEYLEEALGSVVGQDIGFADNIQLILVNSASVDGSGNICKKYRDLYPKNVVYVELMENLGANEARNAGLPHVQGKYVNFLDSDDKWERDAFRKAWTFLENHGDDIDLVAARMIFFGPTTRKHFLDYKFKKDRIVDIFQEPECIQMSMASCFVRREALLGKTFSSGLRLGGDAKLTAEILMENGRYGALSSAVYHYRIREDGAAEREVAREDSRHFGSDLSGHLLDLARLSVKKFGEVIPYIQWHMMYVIQWRMKEPFPDAIGRKQWVRYIRLLHRVLTMVDDHVIWGQKQIYKEHKLFLFRLKYGGYPNGFLKDVKRALWFDHIKIMDFQTDTHALEVFILEQRENELLLEGKVNVPLDERSYEIFARDGVQEFVPSHFPLSAKETQWSLGYPVLVRRGFRFQIPVRDGSNIRFFLRNGRIETEIQPSYRGFYTKLTNKMESSFFRGDRYIICRDGRGILAVALTEESLRRAEGNYRAELKKKKQHEALALRVLAQAWRKANPGKKVWLFIDRINMAGDNAEYVMDYVQKQNRPDLFLAYVLGKDSQDMDRMKGKARVVEFGSQWYRLLYVLAEVIVASTITRFIYEFFGDQTEYIKNLVQYRFVYLQHGVIKDDVSIGNHKFKINASTFVVSVYPEYQSLLEYPYGYSAREVKLTGLARYDKIAERFQEPSRKCILLAPTWRDYLVFKRIDHETGIREYNPYFKESRYFQYYNRLLNDERILKCMRIHGYKGIFRIHPWAVQQESDFLLNDCFGMDDRSESYTDAIINTSLLITDYSSLAIDFAYAKRRVVYTQFDAEEFYKKHSYHKGYFDYERDGFGPVCYDYESTVAEILRAIEEDCRMEELYRDRVDAFFAYRDTHNCERIYNEILKLEQENLCAGQQGVE